MGSGFSSEPRYDRLVALQQRSPSGPLALTSWSGRLTLKPSMRRCPSAAASGQIATQEAIPKKQARGYGSCPLEALALGFERLVVQRGRGSHRHPKSQQGRPFRVVAQAPATGLEDGAWSPVKLVSVAISYGTAEPRMLCTQRGLSTSSPAWTKRCGLPCRAG